jgi:hypothetical protein
MTFGRVVRFLLLFLVAAALQSRPAAQPAARALTVDVLPSPSAGDAGSPQLTVGGGRTILSWLERAGEGAALKYAERTAAGWSSPATVTAGDELVMNWADVPSVRALADGTLVAHWLTRNSPDPEAYDLKVATSRDRGKNWTTAPSPHTDATKTQHGFASFFDAGGEALGVVWLDGRDTAGGKGAMALRAGRVPGQAASDVVVAPRVCDCCPTAAANTADGPIVAFRNRTADEIRDIYVTRLEGGRWTAPVAIHNDGWKINGCPVNGPALAASGRTVVAAWFTLQNGAGRSLAAFSTDAGRTFGAPMRVDDEGSTGRVQVALLPGGAAAVSYVEYGKGPSQLRVRTIGRDGSRSPPAEIAIGVGTQFPRMAAAKGELVFAWTENSRGASLVRTARAKL